MSYTKRFNYFFPYFFSRYCFLRSSLEVVSEEKLQENDEVDNSKRQLPQIKEEFSEF